MRQIEVYEYDELPTEEAKQRARQWWVDTEMENPAWIEEHFKSMHEAIDSVDEERKDESEEKDKLKRLHEDSRACNFTGYCADNLLGDLIEETGEMPTKTQIEEKHRKEWDKELEERAEDIEYIEMNICDNNYEFLDDGQKI